MIAYKNRYSEVVLYLIKKGADVNTKYQDGSTLLHRELQTFKGTMTRLLLENGADILIKTDEGYAPIHIATLHKILDLHETRERIDELLQYGADIDQQDNKGRSALHHAVMFGRKNLVKYLTQKGANREIKDDQGQTVMEYAVDSDNSEIFFMVTNLERDPAQPIL